MITNDRALKNSLTTETITLLGMGAGRRQTKHETSEQHNDVTYKITKSDGR